MNKLKQSYSITCELYNRMLDLKKKKILFSKTIISLLTVVHLLV